MRYLFVILMIALLPLRGWAGHVMAVDMAAQQITAVQHAAATQAQNDAVSSMPADCPMQGQAADDGTSKSSTQCSCDTCELCVAMASAKEAGFFKANFTPRTKPPAAIAGFSSAERSTGLKPPIS